jgi:L-asparaginase II
VTVLAHVVRSGFVESRHHGSVAVLGPAAEPVASVGDVKAAVFPRSANKPLQAVGMLRAGASLAAEDLALATGSHRGQPFHVSRVRAMLGSVGLDESALACPADYPLSGAARDEVMRSGRGPAPVLMNCSGKHAGMLVTCAQAGWSTNGYTDPEHPLQQLIAATVAELTGEPIEAVGVDGCGAPVLSTSLTGLATAYLRLVDAAPGTPERTVADAMRAHPEQVSGSDAEAYDTHLMRDRPGLLAKSGAEGVLAVAVPGGGAVTIKVDDGAKRACLPVLGRALDLLGIGNGLLTKYPMMVLGGGTRVGEVVAVW